MAGTQSTRPLCSSGRTAALLKASAYILSYVKLMTCGGCRRWMVSDSFFSLWKLSFSCAQLSPLSLFVTLRRQTDCLLIHAEVDSGLIASHSLSWTWYTWYATGCAWYTTKQSLRSADECRSARFTKWATKPLAELLVIMRRVSSDKQVLVKKHPNKLLIKAN